MDVTTIFIIGGLLYVAYQSMKIVIELFNNRREKRQENLYSQKEYMNWLNNEEPLYRSLNKYPPDWDRRKVYAQRLCNYTCQSCGRTLFNVAQQSKSKKKQWHPYWTGLHVHHIMPLSKGGDNSLSNLTCLCEECHENQHPHMLKKRLAYYKQKARRARKTHNKNYWESKIIETQQRLEQSRDKD